MAVLDNLWEQRTSEIKDLGDENITSFTLTDQKSLILIKRQQISYVTIWKLELNKTHDFNVFSIVLLRGKKERMEGRVGSFSVSLKGLWCVITFPHS